MEGFSRSKAKEEGGVGAGHTSDSGDNVLESLSGWRLSIES